MNRFSRQGWVGAGALHVVVPNDIDDPATPSGGNVYDRRICRALAAGGWSVREHAVRGAWPRPDERARRGLGRTLAGLPEGSLVLIDGLVASATPEVLAAHTGRLRLVVLMHMPLGDETPRLRGQEAAALAAAVAVVTTSGWCRRRLLDLYDLSPERVHAAPPGVDLAPVVPGSEAGSRLLCVAAVTAGKGHDVLADALAGVADLAWTCVCVGPLDRDPAFVDRLTQMISPPPSPSGPPPLGARAIADRFHLVGPRTGPELEASYVAADVLVLASRGETYGMVVTEALARGIPAVATDGKGLPEALGVASDGSRPGILVPPNDPAALTAGLRRWLTEPGLRRRLRRSAGDRRTTLTGWTDTARLISDALRSPVGVL